MNKNNDINQVFVLYSKGDFLWAKKINDEILVWDPNNIYAKKYKEILAEKIIIKNNIWKKNNIKIKWKTLKCPSCLARIPFSALNSEQKQKIKSGNYNNLEIKCPYCHKKFSLQKRKAPSVLWLKIWDFAIIQGKKYRVTWYVDYLWNWYEWNYSWKLWYLEWILVWEKGDYKYFSEGWFYDDWERTEEFEISEKIIPKFSPKPNYAGNYILINNKKVFFSEKNIVSAKSLYGENSKIFKVWEKVQLYEFSFDGKNYVIEKEWAWTQAEAGIYEIKTVSRKEAFNIFWKDYSSWFYDWKIKNNFTDSLSMYWFFWLIILIFSGKLEYFFYFLWILVLFFIISKFIKLENNQVRNFFIMIILLPILSFISYFVFNFYLDSKKEINLENLKEWKKVELKFNSPDVFKEKVVWRTKYDYWWIETYYEKKTWLKFSIKSEEDKKIIKKINEIVWWNTIYWNSYLEEEIKKMFDNGKIYLLRK